MLSNTSEAEMPLHNEEIRAMRESPISYWLSGLNEGLSQDGQPSEEPVSSEDSAVESPRQKPRRRFMRKEKGKKKMPEYDTGRAESNHIESNSKPNRKEPPRKRSKSAEKAAKSANQELCRSTR